MYFSNDTPLQLQIWYIRIRHVLMTCIYRSQRQRISWSRDTSKSKTLWVNAGKNDFTWSNSQLFWRHGSTKRSDNSKNKHFSSRVRCKLHAIVIIDLQYDLEGIITMKNCYETYNKSLKFFTWNWYPVLDTNVPVELVSSVLRRDWNWNLIIEFRF